MKTNRPISNPTSINRRGFLKTSATVAGTALAGALDVSRFAHAAESGTLKLGLIGCGGRGTGAVGDAMHGDSGTVLWAAADVFPDKIETSLSTLTPMFPGRIQVPRERRFAGLNGYRGVIEHCDVVLIACASRFHPDYALAAVRARKHVFVEKPAAVDVVGIRKILEADALSKQNGTGVLAGVTYRYHLGRREAIQRMHGGEIGEVVAVQCDYLRGPYRLIDRQTQWSEMEYQLRNWYHFTWLSGDDIPQSLVHNLDSALWALGDVMPDHAYGMGGRSTHFQASMGTSFDHHHVTYEYADGRCIYGSCRTATGCFGLNRDVFHGTKGRCHFAAFDRPYFTDRAGKVTWRADAAASGKSPYEQMHVEFLQSIRAGAPFHRAKTLADSTMATVVGQMAVYSGQKIKGKDAWDSGFAFQPAGEVTMDTEPPVKPGADGIYPVAIPGQTKLI
ncbi:MAG TPA: Gfo/Idh/MocA family oxidoreductase [Candidatus Paceibacterota bacterium]|nr:Gfo/Idh/MocA family oxidoreductase [Candidatus Paceibacterota bacterium]